MGKPSILGPLRAVRFLLQKPKTLRYPFEPKEPARRYRGFHLNDWDKCTGCGNCADICPNDAIEMVEQPEVEAEPGEKNERPRLDYGRCCFCGLCVDICPPGSLRLSRDYFHIHFDPKTFVFTPRDEKTDDETYLPEGEYSVLKASLAHRRRDYQGFDPDLDFALFDPQRVEMPEVPPEKRKTSFIEQVLGYDRGQAVRESERCLECALCEDACPANLKISDYVEAIYRDDPEESLRTIFRDNPIPAICGRICMKHCEDACSLSIRGEPLAIRWLKRYAADTVRDYRDALRQRPGEPTGRKIAVIGAGPSGLSLAYFLRLQGHEVVVFDERPAGGGIVRDGPPRYRLPLESIQRDVDHISSLGVEFRYGTRVGRDIDFSEVMNGCDAVFLGIGYTVSRSTRVENAERCLLALDFLRRNKTPDRTPVGKDIVVIGGGNVAMDVAREALRLQAIQHPGERTRVQTVSLEDRDELPATEEEIAEAREEGVLFNPAWGPKGVILDEGGDVRGLLCMKCLSVFDENGRFSPTFDEEREMVLETDMVIEAIGQGPDFSFLPGELRERLEFTTARKVKVDEGGMTSIPGVFAGGDIVNLNMDAVTAIRDAKAAAEGIERWLSDQD
ncbi:MAG: FAD-dependent oxidoreductase [Candidatus Fermentibacteraceae bacterium]